MAQSLKNIMEMPKNQKFVQNSSNFSDLVELSLGLITIKLRRITRPRLAIGKIFDIRSAAVSFLRFALRWLDQIVQLGLL